MGKILQILNIENRDLAHAQTFCTRVDQAQLHSLVPRPVRAIRVTGGGLEPSAIVLGEFSRQASQVTSHPKSPRTTGNEAANYILSNGYS